MDAVRGPVPGRRARSRVVPLPARFAGETSASKLRRVRRAMRERGADALLVTTLDAIAWLFNVRGSDVAYNPVVIAYAVVTAGEAVLHVDRGKLDAAAVAHLERTARIEPYAAIRRTLRGLARRKATVWIDQDSTSLMCGRFLDGAKPVFAPSPIPRMKARKNEVELAGIRAAHRRDGVAMVRFLHWLDRSLPAGGITEMSAAARLEELRSAGEHFQGLSFPTIAGYADHGAIIHYSVDEASNVPLRPEGLFLVDSGAHYLDGTTDITRTLLLGGWPTGAQRDCYTRVLKGHIAHRDGALSGRHDRGAARHPRPRRALAVGPGLRPRDRARGRGPTSTCTRGRSRSATARPRFLSSPATCSRTSPGTTSRGSSGSASRTSSRW